MASAVLNALLRLSTAAASLLLKVPFLSVSRSDQLFLPVDAVDEDEVVDDWVGLVVDCVGLVVDWVVVVVVVGAVCDCAALVSDCCVVDDE